MSLVLISLLYWGVLTALAIPLFVLVRAILRSWFKVREVHPAVQWKWFFATTFVVFLPTAIGLEFFRPISGTYDPIVARYWMSRAATEAEREKKEAHVRRVALSSEEYGWFIASQAIGRAIEERQERCVLRTILANLPNIRNQSELRAEAEKECAA